MARVNFQRLLLWQVVAKEKEKYYFVLLKNRDEIKLWTQKQKKPKKCHIDKTKKADNSLSLNILRLGVCLRSNNALHVTRPAEFRSDQGTRRLEQSLTNFSTQNLNEDRTKRKKTWAYNKTTLTRTKTWHFPFTQTALTSDNSKADGAANSPFDLLCLNIICLLMRSRYN